MAIAGGIDVGGTKIEARLFSDNWDDLAKRRIDTPQDNYENLLDAIGEQFRWLEKTANDNSVPIGVGVPGLVDRKTGCASIANLPAGGRDIRGDFSRQVGRQVWFENDCRAFALSEARLGAGRPYDTVLGLVLGTGVAAGFVAQGRLLSGRNGAAGELGHLPIPARIAQTHELPILECGCGRMGCYETLMSGPGLVRLAKSKSGQTMTPANIAERAISGTGPESDIMDVWVELTVSLIQTAMLMVDPDCIVLGGGLSNINGIETRLAKALPTGLLTGLAVPPIVLAQGGDSSGARGAALVAHTEFVGIQNA